MKIAVAGGTGLIGRLVVEAARERGHGVTMISRTAGVDLVTGEGLTRAMTPCDKVIDVSNVSTTKKSASVAFFEAATRNLLATAAEADIGHHLPLSIVGIDRLPFGYYEGKRRQEALIAASSLPWTVLRATQFHEFPGQLLSNVRVPSYPSLGCARPPSPPARWRITCSDLRRGSRRGLPRNSLARRSTNCPTSPAACSS